MISRLFHENQEISAGDLRQAVEACKSKLRKLPENDRVLLVEGDRLQTVFVILACLELKLAWSIIGPHVSAQARQSIAEKFGARWLYTYESGLSELSIETQNSAGGLALLSSGSQGEPRAIALAESALQHSAACHAQWLKQENLGWALALPLHHIGGLSVVLRAFFLKQPLAICRVGEIADIFQTLQISKISGISLVPTQWRRLMAFPAKIAQLESNKILLIGGAGFDPLVKKQTLELAPKACLLATYGMTETASQIATASVHDPLNERVSLLYPTGTVETKLDQAANLLVRGKALFSGYLESGKLLPLETDWFATGDLAEWQRNGSLQILGRQREVIISGGVNIGISELKSAAAMLPELIEAEFLGIPDPEWGERLVLLYSLRENSAISSAAVIAHFRALLGPEKTPKHCIELSQIPLLPSGKVDRPTLLQIAKQAISSSN